MIVLFFLKNRFVLTEFVAFYFESDDVCSTVYIYNYVHVHVHHYMI